MNIYTDGACKENLRDNGVGCGSGGWAYVILDQPSEREDMEIVMMKSDSKDGTTNQEMEITAVAEAFEALKHSDHKVRDAIVLYSDSAYVINCLKDRWYDKWNANGWLNSKKKPVENRDAWERLINSIKDFNVDFFHVKRNTTKYIRMVDGMAKKASKQEKTQEH